jgi:hypothetical protein
MQNCMYLMWEDIIYIDLHLKQPSHCDTYEKWIYNISFYICFIVKSMYMKYLLNYILGYNGKHSLNNKGG